MSCDSLTTSSFMVTEVNSNVSLEGTVNCSDATATFAPSTNLHESTQYSASISTAVKDLQGYSLAAAYSWSFTTAAIAPADVRLVSVTARQTSVVIIWDDPSDPRFDHALVTWSPGGSTPVQVDKTLETYTATNLTADSTYTFTIKSASASGVISSGIVFSVTTGPSSGPDRVFSAIHTPADLDNLRNNTSGDYILMADIDLSGFANWTPLPRYFGELNGNGHSISHLTFDQSAESNVGLFVQLDQSGVIERLKLEGVAVVGRHTLGGLVGTNYGQIESCSVSGVVAGYVQGSTISYNVGGLVGSNSGGTIIDCHSSAQVSGDHDIGGLVGHNSQPGTVSTSSALGAVSGANAIGGLVGSNAVASNVLESFATATVEGNQDVGGLVGRNEGGTISNSYAAGAVSGANSIGGLIGECTSHIIHCCALGPVTGSANTGGLIGNDLGTALDSSYFNIETTGIADPSGTQGKTDAQMKTQGTFDGWDFVNTWAMSTQIQGGYPYLINNPPQ